MPKDITNLAACIGAIVLIAPAGFCAEPVEVTNSQALKRALRKATPGTRIALAGGRYKGGLWVGRVHGKPGSPIVVAA